jgi:hypothetical protein
MKTIKAYAALALAVVFMGGIGAAITDGETTVGGSVPEIVEIVPPASVTIPMDPGEGPANSAYADAVITSNVPWIISAEDNSDWNGDGVIDGNGKMKDNKGTPTDPTDDVEMTNDFEVDFNGGAWTTISGGKTPVGGDVAVGAGMAYETSYHQDVEWSDAAGNYQIIVTWYIEPA